MVESELAKRLGLGGATGRGLDARLLITPPLTLIPSSLDLILVAVVLTLLGTLLFHKMTKKGSERWKSPTLPLIFCLVLVVTSILLARFLSLGVG